MAIFTEKTKKPADFCFPQADDMQFFGHRITVPMVDAASDYEAVHQMISSPFLSNSGGKVAEGLSK